MKTTNGGYHRRFKGARLVLCMILVVMAASGLVTPVKANGAFTHNEIVRMALSGNYGELPTELVNLLTTYSGAVESGSVFPDWGMAVRIFPTDTDVWDNLAEAAHHQNFEESYLQYMLSDFSPPYSEDELKAIAFYFGMVSHNVADPIFHNNFLPTAQHMDNRFPNGVPGHLEIEQAVDSFNYGRTHCGTFCPVFVSYGIDWFLPEEPILAAYLEPGVIDPTFNPLPTPPDSGSLEFGWGEYKTRSMYQIGIAWNTYGKGDFLQRLSWTAGNYFSSTNGTEDQARQTVIKWQQIWDLLTEPVTTIELSPAQPDGNNNWYRQPVTVSFSTTAPFELGGEVVTWYSLDGGVTFRQYAEPFTVSSEGENHISYYSVSSPANLEPVKTLTLKIDLTPPVVNVWADQSRYTRTEPFVVHFSGSDAVSGMASLMADFDGQPVADGQTVDLFLLPLGNYTLTARGEDQAGWITETSESIELYASIEGLQGTVDRLCQEKLITKSGTCQELSAKLKAALAARDRGNNKTAANVLKAFQHAVKAHMDKSIIEDAPWLLLMDSDYAIADLSH